jgi:hypothetical protein
LREGGIVYADTTPSATPTVSAVLNVVNATTESGVAASVEDAFAARGFTAGEVSTADALADTSTIEFGPGSEQAATVLRCGGRRGDGGIPCVR